MQTSGLETEAREKMTFQRLFVFPSTAKQHQQSGKLWVIREQAEVRALF